MTTTIARTEMSCTVDRPVVLRLYDPQPFREGGLAQKADQVRGAGIPGDEVLLHITPEEFEEIKGAWGPPTINPRTGLPQYGFLKRLGKKLKSGATRLMRNPLISTLAPIAANIFLPGVGGLIAQAGLGAAKAKATGGNPLTGALLGGAGHFIGGGGLGKGGVDTSMNLVAPSGNTAGPLSRLKGLFGGKGAGTLGGVTDAAGNVIPGTEVLNPTPGPLGKIRGFFTNPATGRPAWGKIAGAGAGALALLNAAGGGGQEEPAPSPRPEGWDEPGQQLRLRRDQVSPGPDYFNYGRQGGEFQFFGEPRYEPVTPMARGGLSQVGLPPMRAGGHHVRGPGTGRSDEIEALLSDGEYVIDAESVALLGDGSLDAGAKRLDELRANLRKHKGSALAKGKFSPSAKSPEQYMGQPRKAKGGRIRGDWVRRVISGNKGVKPPLELREAQLESAQRLAKELREQQKPPSVQGGSGSTVDIADARSRVEAIKALAASRPIKKAEGGSVQELEAFADRLEAALRMKDEPQVTQLSQQMDAKYPQSSEFFKTGLAKGGKVSNLLAKFKELFSAPPEPPPPIRPRLSPEDMAYMVQWLKANAPESPALRHNLNYAPPAKIDRPSLPASAVDTLLQENR